MGRAKIHKHFRGFSNPERERDKLSISQNLSLHDLFLPPDLVLPRLSRPSGSTRARITRNRNGGK